MCTVGRCLELNKASHGAMREAAVEAGCLAAPGGPEPWRTCPPPAVELPRRGEVPGTETNANGDEPKRWMTCSILQSHPRSSARLKLGHWNSSRARLTSRRILGREMLVKVCLGQVAGPRAFLETGALCKMRYGCRKPEGTGMVTETAAQTLGSWSASTFDSPSAMSVARI